MNKTASDIVLDFFKIRFGNLMAISLFKQYLKRYNIDDFEKISIVQQINFGQKIIESMYHNFYSPDRIQNLKSLYLLRFSINEAVRKVETAINVPIDIKLEYFDEISAEKVNATLSEIYLENVVQFGFECTNLIKGVLIFVFEDIQAIKLGNNLIEIIDNIHNNTDEIDEAKISSIYKFFNLILLDFVKSIGNLYNGTIDFNTLYYKDFKQKYFNNGKFIAPKKFFKSTINFSIKSKDYSGKIFFFMN